MGVSGTFLGAYNLGLATGTNTSSILNSSPLVDVSKDLTTITSSLVAFLPRSSNVRTDNALRTRIGKGVEVSRVGVCGFKGTRVRKEVRDRRLVLGSPTSAVSVSVGKLSVGTKPRAGISGESGGLTFGLLTMDYSVTGTRVSLGGAVRMENRRLSLTTGGSIDTTASADEVRPLKKRFDTGELFLESRSKVSLNVRKA